MLNDLQQLNDLKARVDEILSTVRTEQIKKKTWEVERRKLLLGVENRRELTGILLQVVELYKELGGDNEQQILERVQDFVSYGLSAVFGDNYKFLTKMRTEGKELKVDFGVVTNGLQTGVVGAKEEDLQRSYPFSCNSSSSWWIRAYHGLLYLMLL